MNKIVSCLALIFLTISYSFADDAKIKAAIAPLELEEVEIIDSPLAGIKTVVSDKGIFYASEDGQYFLHGKLLQINKDGVVDLSNVPLVKKLQEVNKEAIVFKAENEKYAISVWTDYTCPYCVKLHKQMEEYNKLGITVRYLAFPRAGGKSAIAKKMETIWQDKEAGKLFDKAVDGKEPEAAEKSTRVAKQYNLGVQFGVSGTPAWVSDDGLLIVGYKKPQDLLEVLEMQAQLSKKADESKEETSKEQENTEEKK